MISRWIFLLAFVPSFINSYAQEAFYLIEDFGHLQAKGYSIEEIDAHLYVIGMAIAESDSIYEENIHITKYDLEGNFIKAIFFDNDKDRGSLNLVKDQCVSIYENQLLITVNIGANIFDAIILVDKELNEAKLVTYYTLGLGSNIGVGAQSHYFTKDEKLVFPLSSNLNKNFTGSFDLNNKEFQFYDFSSDDDHGYAPSKILPLGTDTMLIVGGVSTKGLDGTYSTGSRTTYFMKLDKDMNLISEVHLDNPFHAIKKSNDEIIITAAEFDRDGTGKFRTENRPKILSVNPHTAEILWENNLADTIFKKRFDFTQSLIFSHDSTAYITVGIKYSDPNGGGPRIATIQKVDSLGNNLWFKCIADEYDGSELILYDVIATSDGHYVACGLRGDATENDGFDSRAQQFLIKFDEDGNIVDRLSSTEEVNVLQKEKYIKVYPNPGKGIITIEHLTQQACSYELYDSTGILVMRYSSGNYFLKVKNEKGRVIQVEQVVINN